jgi:hypothetical protein
MKVEEKRYRREHMEYLKARTAASIAIGRNRDWCGCNMSLAAKIWRCKSLSKSTRARVVKILYDQYWHGGNRSKRVHVSEAVNLKKCDLCGEDDSQCHIYDNDMQTPLNGVCTTRVSEDNTWVSQPSHQGI